MRGVLWIGEKVWCLLSLGLLSPETAALGMLGSGLESIYSYGLLVSGLIFATAEDVSQATGEGPVASLLQSE